MKTKGKISWFGGPDDTGVAANENLALYWDVAQVQLMPELFLPRQPGGTTGLARRLDPDALYCAMRWDYSEVSKDELRYSVVRVQKGKLVQFLRPVDYGPDTGTGRLIDVSPGAMVALLASTDDEVEVELIRAYGEAEVPVEPPPVVEPPTGKLVMICVGHHPDAPGAVNAKTRTSEWEFNSVLARKIGERMVRNRFTITSRESRSWSQGQLDRIVNASGAEVVIELHANAFNGKVSGTEMLYWHSSTGGFALAGNLIDAAVGALGLPARGRKGRYPGDRGALFLGGTSMPAVICESFFIDNDSDLKVGYAKMDELAAAYASVLDSIV